MKQSISSRLRRVALAVLLLAASSMASAGVIHVDVDTEAFGAASGYLDMQLSASSGLPLATVVVSNMVGFDPLAFIDSWGVTPTGNGYLFRNDTSNDLFHAVTFGGLLSFDLTFAGEIDPLTSYVSRFVIAAFDEAFAPLGNYDPVTGALADFSWTPSQVAGAEGSIGLSLADSHVTVIPEPADTLLMGAGLAIMALALRRRRQQSGSMKT